MGWGVGAPCVWGGAVSAGGGKIFGVDGRAGGRVRGETDVNAHQSKCRINLDSSRHQPAGPAVSFCHGYRNSQIPRVIIARGVKKDCGLYRL